MAKRFLPTQEWSACGRKIVDEFWRQCGRQFGGVGDFGNSEILVILAIRRLRAVTMRYSPMDSRSPVDHSCESRNLILQRRQRREI